MILGSLLRCWKHTLYHLSFDGTSFCLKVKKEFCLNQFQGDIFASDPLHKEILKIAEETNGDTVSYLIRLPLITFPNRAKKRPNYEEMKLCCMKFSILFYYLNGYDKDYVYSEVNCLSLSPQQVAISTVLRKDNTFHAAPLSVAFTEKMRKAMAWKAKEGNVRLSVCEETALKAYLGLTCTVHRQYQREMEKLDVGFGHTGLRIGVRVGGVPTFTVPGNCACLGANPDSFKFDGECDSHNMDTASQQLSLLAGLASFWNDFLIPLEAEYDVAHPEHV